MTSTRRSRSLGGRVKPDHGETLKFPRVFSQLQYQILFLPKLPLPAVLHRLVGGPRVVFAVGRLIARAVAAEAEIFRAWIADGPFAGFVGEMKNGDAATLGQVHQPERLRFRQ